MRFHVERRVAVLRKGGLTMVATDGHRLAMVEVRARWRITDAYRALLLKRRSELQKLASDSDPTAIVKFSGDDNRLFFQLGDRSCR